jgi:hypothetical protein
VASDTRMAAAGGLPSGLDLRDPDEVCHDLVGKLRAMLGILEGSQTLSKEKKENIKATLRESERHALGLKATFRRLYRGPASDQASRVAPGSDPSPGLEELRADMKEMKTMIAAIIAKTPETPATPTPLWSKVAAKPRSKSTFPLIVKPVGTDPEDLVIDTAFEDDLSMAIDPMGNHLHILKSRRTKEGVLLEFETQDGRDQAKALLKPEAFKTSTPLKMKPKLIIYDLKDGDLEDFDAFMSVVTSQGGMPPELEEDLKHTTLRFKMKARIEGQFHAVIEVTPSLFKWFIGRGRIYHDMESHRVSKFVSSGQCFRCLSFGHLQRECPGPERCRKCSGDGHKSMNCNNRGACFLCKEFNLKFEGNKKRDINHGPCDKKCPSLIRMLSLAEQRTDYG